MITIEDFAKIELKTGKIVEASEHPNADKLVVLKVDLGETEEVVTMNEEVETKTSVPKIRQIVAGIKKSYDPASLVGKNIVVVANLQPAVLRGVESQGMLLAASDENGISVLSPDRDIIPGSRVK